MSKNGKNENGILDNEDGEKDHLFLRPYRAGRRYGIS
jgi:hypothetical protein